MLDNISSSIKRKKYDLLFSTLVLVLCILFFRYLWYNIPTDMQVHSSFINEICEGERHLPINFLYYLTIYLFSGFNTSNLAFASIFTLSLSVLLKFLISRKIIDEILIPFNNKNLLINLSAFLMLIVFSLPSIPFVFSGYLYVGTYPPNIWHNSTTIFVFPFALLLFWESYKQIMEHNNKRLLYLIILLVINVLAKPSFVLVFIFAFPLILLIKYRFSSHFWINLVPVLLAVLFVLIEYFLIYDINIEKVESGVTINPFNLLQYRLNSENWFYTLGIFLLSLITSYLFVIVSLLRCREEMKDILVNYAIVSAAIAILLRNLLCETGLREFHGNFAWQVILCTYPVFLILLSKLLNKLRNDKWNLKRYKPELIIFFLHLGSGLLYISKIVFIHDVL
jgi:hypothetical protein